ncbi:MAG: amidohydrolase family protein [Thermomicrobiales bacterium]
MSRIVDGDCHISPVPGSAPHISTEELLRRMDRSGVDKALTWLQPPYERGLLPEGNAYVAAAMHAHPDRILGFGWADPHLGLEAALDAVDRCLHDHGFAGVKLNGAQNEFVIDDSVLVMPVVEKIAAAGAILALHIGGDSPERTHPWRAGNIARRYPDLRMLIVHIGGAAFHDLSRAAIEIARDYPNMTMIGSAVRSGAVLNAIRALGADRVCFGSDTPFELMHVELARYRALLEGEISPEEIAQVLGGNLLRMLRPGDNDSLPVTSAH